MADAAIFEVCFISKHIPDFRLLLTDVSAISLLTHHFLLFSDLDHPHSPFLLGRCRRPPQPLPPKPGVPHGHPWPPRWCRRHPLPFASPAAVLYDLLAVAYFPIIDAKDNILFALVTMLRSSASPPPAASRMFSRPFLPSPSTPSTVPPSSASVPSPPYSPLSSRSAVLGSSRIT